MVGWGYDGRVKAQGAGMLRFKAYGLPGWLQMAEDGTLSGEPPAATEGVHTFMVEATDDVYVPALAMNRYISAQMTLRVVPQQPAWIGIASGNEQVGRPGQYLPQELVVTVRHALTSAPIPGAVVKFEDIVVIADGAGIARTWWRAPYVAGNSDVVVTAGGGVATFSVFTYEPVEPDNLETVSGAGNDFVPEAQPISTPNPITDPQVEYRAVSSSSGTLSANFSLTCYNWSLSTPR